MERSDGRLAPVSYLFGAPGPAEHDAPSERDIARSVDSPAVDSFVVDSPAVDSFVGDSLVGDTAGPAANGRTPASGWYIEPGNDDAPSSRDDVEPEPEAEPEAPAIAAARRFLSIVDTRGVEPATTATPSTDDEPAAAGVRFVEEPESASAKATKPEPAPVRKASINALARKGMSSAEMITLLENREIDPDEAAAEVERLEGAGLLDDRVLAEDLVQSLRDRKGLGKSAITAELRRRRIDQSAIDEALESVDVDDELERATEVAIKRAGQLSSYDRTTAERRLSAFLQRRGYSGTVVGAAVKAALGPAGPRFR